MESFSDGLLIIPSLNKAAGYGMYDQDMPVRKQKEKGWQAAYLKKSIHSIYLHTLHML